MDVIIFLNWALELKVNNRLKIILETPPLLSKTHNIIT